MISALFGLIAILAAFIATFEQQMRRAVLALWLCGIATGSLYLSLGVEFLAIIQWILSTLVAISFILFAVMFGEFQTAGVEERGEQKNRLLLHLILALAVGFGFLLTLGLGMQGFLERPLPHSSEWGDLAEIGKMLSAHLLAVEVLIILLFLTLVGGGVIARGPVGGGGQAGERKEDLR